MSSDADDQMSGESTNGFHDMDALVSFMLLRISGDVKGGVWNRKGKWPRAVLGIYSRQTNEG